MRNPALSGGGARYPTGRFPSLRGLRRDEAVAALVRVARFRRRAVRLQLGRAWRDLTTTQQQKVVHVIAPLLQYLSQMEAQWPSGGILNG